MEKRTITQVKCWKLIMNPITDRAEARTIVAISDDYQKLVNWYQGELLGESWEDGRWNKRFSKGSLLEWFNPIYRLDGLELFGQGIDWEWIEEEEFNNLSIFRI